MKLLLEKGADVESKDRQWPDAAIVGRREGTRGGCEAAAREGADVKSKDGVGQTPLSRAA